MASQLPSTRRFFVDCITRALPILLAGGLCAGAWTAAAEERVPRAALMKLIRGKTITWSDSGGQSYYGPGGDYRFASSRGRSEGTYTVSDGVVCMKFTNNRLRCDAWYKDGNRYYIKPMRSDQSQSNYGRPTYDVISIN